MLKPENATVLQRHVAAETAFEIEATLATLTEDCMFEDVPTGEVHRGHAGVRAYYSEWWSAFGNVPSGSRLYVPSGAWIFISFRDGLMSGERFYYDRATLLSQVGAQ